MESDQRRGRAQRVRNARMKTARAASGAVDARSQASAESARAEAEEAAGQHIQNPSQQPPPPRFAPHVTLRQRLVGAEAAQPNGALACLVAGLPTLLLARGAALGLRALCSCLAVAVCAGAATYACSLRDRRTTSRNIVITLVRFLAVVAVVAAFLASSLGFVVAKCLAGAFGIVVSAPRSVYQALGFGSGGSAWVAPPRGLVRYALGATIDAVAPPDSFQRSYALLVVPFGVVFVCGVIMSAVQAVGLGRRAEEVWTAYKFAIGRGVAFAIGLAMLEDAAARGAYGNALTLWSLAYGAVATSVVGASARVPKTIISGVCSLLFAAALALVMPPRVESKAWEATFSLAGATLAAVTLDGLWVLLGFPSVLKTMVSWCAFQLRSAMRLWERFGWPPLKLALEATDNLLAGSLRVLGSSLLGVDEVIWRIIEAIDLVVCYTSVRLNHYVLQPALSAVLNIGKLAVTVSTYVNRYTLKPLVRGAVATYKFIVSSVVKPTANALVTMYRFVVDEVVKPIVNAVAHVFRFLAKMVGAATSYVLDHLLVPAGVKLRDFVTWTVWRPLCWVARRLQRPIAVALEPALTIAGTCLLAASAARADSVQDAVPFLCGAAAVASVALLTVGRSVAGTSTLFRPLGRSLAALGLRTFLSLDLHLFTLAAVVLSHVRRALETVASIAAELRAAILRFLEAHVWSRIKAILRVMGRAAASLFETLWRKPLLASFFSAIMLFCVFLGHRSGTFAAAGNAIVAAALALVRSAEYFFRGASSETARAWGSTSSARTTGLRIVSRVDSIVASGSVVVMCSDASFAWLAYAIVLASSMSSRSLRRDWRRDAPTEQLQARAEVSGRLAVKALLAPAALGAISSAVLPRAIHSVVFGVVSRAWLGGAAFAIAMDGLHWRNRFQVPPRVVGGSAESPARHSPRVDAIIAVAKTTDPVRRFGDETCVICMDALASGKDASEDEAQQPVALPCGHEFHEDCLRSWLVRQPRCPTCRQEPDSVVGRIVL